MTTEGIESIDTALGAAVRSHGGVSAYAAKLLEQIPRQAVPQQAVNVRHIFGPHVYLREYQLPAGLLLVSREHRARHECLLIRGRLSLYGTDGTRTEIAAPAEFEAEAGPSLVYVLEDTTLVNRFTSDETDVDALDREIFSDEAPPDTRPMLKPDGDFEALLAEQGGSAAALRKVSERSEDLCAFPHGVYKVKVGRSLIEGRGLIATADIAAGEIICPGTWGKCRTPAGRYTNHARDPNAFFRYDDAGVAWLIASRAIAGCVGPQDGEEITIDYRCAPRARWENLS